VISRSEKKCETGSNSLHGKQGNRAITVLHKFNKVHGSLRILLTNGFILQADCTCTHAALGAVALETALGLSTQVTQTGPVQHTVNTLPLMRAGSFLERVSTFFSFNTYGCREGVIGACL